MQLYEVNFKSLVSPTGGELVVPFREVVVRKLERVPGAFTVVGEITCRRLRDYVAASVSRAVFFAQLGPVDRAKRTLSVDALITFVFTLLELNSSDFLMNASTDEITIDQSFLKLATKSQIRLNQFEEFDHFVLQRQDEDSVPRAVRRYFGQLDTPIFFRVW